MCGRVTLRTNLNVIAKEFDVQGQFDLPLRYNIAPTQQVAIIPADATSNDRQLLTARWGLIPSWAKDLKIGNTLINARADTIATKPSFRSAFKKRRCLVPSDGYYEWLRVQKTKQPYLYEVDGGAPFALAGLWEQWWGPDSKDGPPIESCTLITTEANELASQVHDRMPVILAERDYDVWLDPANQNVEDLQKLLDPFPPDRMSARPVNPVVNNARNEVPECVEPMK